MTGEPLRLSARTITGLRTSVQSADVLEPAASRPADLELLHTQLARLGGTGYELVNIEATIEGSPMVPMSLLNKLRRDLIDPAG